MALMHFQHSSIGKKTHGPRAAANYISYISRGTLPLHSNRMPSNRVADMSWISDRAFEDRVDGRVCDTFIVALPLELSTWQRQFLVLDWCSEVTIGRAAFLFCIHDSGKDSGNPHAHILIRDRDYSVDRPEKARGRVLGTSTGFKEVREASERGLAVPPRVTTYELRCSWAAAVNRAMTSAGVSARVDPRSNRARGLLEKPGRHVTRVSKADVTKADGRRGRKLTETAVGSVLGELLVLRSEIQLEGKWRVLCRCFCGVEKEITRASLLAGTKSCGCLRGRKTACHE